MAVPVTFTESMDWSPVHSDIQAFGESIGVDENDLLSAMRAVDVWYERFTDCFTLEHRGEQITWCRYELLIWTLGESVRRILQRSQPLLPFFCYVSAAHPCLCSISVALNLVIADPG